MKKELNEYDFPRELKDMNLHDMELLSYSIRDFLVDNVSKTGGHLASNLGVVELTIGLHKVFDSPKDKIIWDVGHQSYVHKILTGRANNFEGLRQFNGMSGFPKRNESPHDIYDTGHSSTSISAASGIAAARDIKGEDYEVIAVLGDGSLTGGMTYEALNNLGISKSKVIVILNDNGMSISKNIGGVSEHLGKLRTSEGYRTAKTRVKSAVEKIPYVGSSLKTAIGDAKDSIKYAIAPGGVIFEELGITYLGPVDGHNLQDVIDILKIAKNADGPVLVHIITKKGKGYKQAEQNPDKFHGIGPFDTETGIPLKESGLTYSKVFGNHLLTLGAEHKDIVAISAAMCDATGLGEFNRRYKDRFFDVGIAEAHAVSFAAGLAVNGLKPYVAIYSSFLQRAYDQIMEDVCLQDLSVVFCIDRAGIVGADGETHHGVFDISYLLPLPNMTILTPCDGVKLEEMMDYAYKLDGPVAIRYPRGNCGEALINHEFDGENIVLNRGKDVQILCVGSMLSHGLEAREILKGEGIDAGITYVGIVKSKQIKTRDAMAEELGVSKVFGDKKKRLIATVEDNVVIGGFGSFITTELEVANNLVLGWPDNFVEHGDCDSLYEKYGLDGKSIAERIMKKLERKA